MKIDTTATILQVSPASAGRAGVAGPQKGTAGGSGFAQLLASLLTGEASAPATKSLTPATDVPREAANSKKPTDPSASFNAIFAILGSQSAAPQPAQAAVQAPPATGSPAGKSAGTGVPVAAAPANAVGPLAAATTPLTAGTNPGLPNPAEAVPASPQSKPERPAPGSAVITPEMAGPPKTGGSCPPVQQPSTPPVVAGAAQPGGQTAPATQVVDPNSTANASAETAATNANQTPPSDQTSGALNEKSLSATAGTASAVVTPAIETDTTPAASTLNAGATTTENGLAAPSNWSFSQFRQMRSEPGAARTIVESIARKVGSSVGAKIQELAQRFGQADSALVAGNHWSLRPIDGPKAVDTESNLANLKFPTHGDVTGNLQSQLEGATQVAHSELAMKSQPHHPVSTLAELPHRIADIVTSRLEKPDSADQSGVVLRLDPPELGRVTVHVSMAHDVVSIRLVASGDEAKQVLETHLSDLQQSLSDQGVALNQCQVECNTGGGSQSSDRNWHWQQPNELDFLPFANRQAPVVATSSPQAATRTSLDYVA